LDKELVIVEQTDKSFRFISSTHEIAACYSKINVIINSINTIEEKEVKIQGALIGKQVSDYIGGMKSDAEFADIKFNSSI
jgi:hypothetical protein